MRARPARWAAAMAGVKGDMPDAGSSCIDGAFQAEAHVPQSIGDDTFTVFDTPPARFGHHRMPEGFGALKIGAPEGNLMIMPQMPPLPRANNFFIARSAGRLSL